MVQPNRGAEVVTRQHFDIHIGRLIVLPNWPDDASEWWSVCRDIDPAVFEAACSRALKTRTFFPLPAELLADCDAVKSAVRPPQPVYPQVEDLPVAKFLEIANPLGGEPLKIRVTREWKHDCDSCSDTGWASRQCPETSCGRRFEHSAHEFVEKCACIEWNPTIRRRKEAAIKYAAEKAAA